MGLSSGVPRIEIHPNEEFGVSFRYTPNGNLPSGSTPNTASAAAENLDTGDDTTSVVLDSATGVISQTSEGDYLVTVTVQGGGSSQDETRHKVTVTTNLDTGETFVDVFVLVVTDGVDDA